MGTFYTDYREKRVGCGRHAFACSITYNFYWHVAQPLVMLVNLKETQVYLVVISNQ